MWGEGRRVGRRVAWVAKVKARVRARVRVRVRVKQQRQPAAAKKGTPRASNVLSWC